MDMIREYTHLYHGTSAERLDGIFEKGIVPGTSSGLTVYGDMRPLSDYVYLSYLNGMAYALNASQHLGKILLVRVKMGGLDPDLFRPDEDFFFEFLFPREGVIPKATLKENVQLALDRMESDKRYAADSFSALTNIAYAAPIAPGQIEDAVEYNFHDDFFLAELYKYIIDDSQGQPTADALARVDALYSRMFLERVSVRDILGKDRSSMFLERELDGMQEHLDDIKLTLHKEVEEPPANVL